ncbi:hypothetical protein ACTA71_011141 [Dictyostelium dimigraforme]
MPKNRDQQIKISHFLRDNLLNYPESKIFRELIQNAEDARADEVIIKVDEGTYDINGLFYKDNQEIENSRELLGPSILIYNNSTFQEQDWDGICHVSQGSKKENLKSVGNFGLGWNSVYHITDNPIVYSGDNVWFSDPNERMCGGLFFDLKDENDFNNCKGFLRPFIQFKETKCNPREYFNGTIIRLPLRIHPSEIKKGVLTMDSIKKILNEFAKDINEILIFLKSIASISIIINNQIINSVSISNYSEIKDQREKVSIFLSNIVDNEMKNPSSAVELAEILCSKKSQSSCESIFQIDLEINRNGVTESISYLVSQGILIDKQLIELVKKNKEIKLISYGGTAIPISVQNTSSVFKGKPFTFLPIGALVYEIPLHVNGYFRLSNARDNIIYSLTEVEEASESLSKQWNMFISETIIPHFYIKSLEYIKSNYGGELYSYFPYRCNNVNYRGQAPAFDLSIKTMQFIIGGNYFINYFNSKEYLSLKGSVIISTSDMPPDFILALLEERNIKTIRLSNELLMHFKNLGIPLTLFSKPYLCTILKSSPLKQYSEEVINFIVCSETIEGKHLNMVKILPVYPNNTQLGCLMSVISLFGNQFLYMDDQVYDLLFKYFGYDLANHLKFSALPPNFRLYVSSICRFYPNIRSINLSDFIAKLKSLNKQFLTDNVQNIWDCIDEFRNYERVELSQITHLHIVPYRLNSTQMGITSYHKSNLLMYKPNFIPIEPILNKLGIYLVKEGHQFNSLLDGKTQISKLLNYLQKVHLSLDSNDINKLRAHLIQTNNQVSLSGSDLFIFYNLCIHPCIGDENQKFSDITTQSVCVNYQNIDQFEINGIKLIKVGELLNYRNLAASIPSKRILNSEKEVYRNYLLTNISSFGLDLSIEIIKKFLTLYVNFYIDDSDLRKLKFIPSEDGIYSNLDSYLILNPLEKRLIRKIEPSKIVHPSLETVVFGCMSNLSLTHKPSDNYICSKITSLLSMEDSIETYKCFIEYLYQRGDNISDLIKCFKDISFIPASEFDTYDGFAPKTSKISLSESALSVHKDYIFTSKTPIKGIDQLTHPIYKYLSSTLNDDTIQHLINLNDMEFNGEESFNPNSVFDNTYKQIDNLIKNNLLDGNQRKRISQIQLIWIDGQLVSKDKVFYNSPNPNMDFNPYFYDIKPKHGNLYRLFRLLNIKEKPDLVDFIQLMISIQDEYDIESSNSKELFELVIFSLQYPGLNKEILTKSKIKLPTTDYQFVDFERVLFLDNASLPHEYIEDGYYALHNNISENIASRLGIIKFSQLVQSKVAFDDHSFGQKEDLVDRLKQILHDYKVEVFLNEMVQNAHDAGSTEVKLILDYNSLKQQFLSDNPNLKECKDLPSYFESSLLFYNNSVFAEKDVKNVQVMSATFKKQDETCIGRYGLGINSMYSFSDCPCILSGEYLMVFDPFETHMNQSTKYSPGAKFKISEYKGFIKYFKPFIHLQSILGFDLDEGKVNCTIIRLPLRKTLNEDRFISPQKWNEKSVLDYLEKVKKSNLENVMFFTNIDSIEVSKLSMESKKLEQLISIQKKSSLSLNTSQFNNLLKIPTHASEYTFTIIPSEKTKITEKFIVGQVIEEEFKDPSEYPDNKALKFLSVYNTEKRRPVGGIAFKLPDFTGNSYNFTPKSFCYLPYNNLISDIPVHIHANFSTTSSRHILENVKSSELYNIEDILSKKVKPVQQSDSLQLFWNQLIVTEIIAPLYINTLILFKNKYIKGNDSDKISRFHDFYYHLFPVLSDPLSNHFILNMLVKKFYGLAYSEKADVFLHCPGVEIKKNPKDTFYTDIGFLGNLLSVSILKCISHLGFNVNVSPPLIYYSCNLARSNWLKEDTISMVLQRKELDPQVINTQDIANLIFYFKNSPELLNNCQVLAFNNKERGFVNIENTECYQLYNQAHYDMAHRVLDLKFIDAELTDTIRNLDMLEAIHIYDLNYVDFYFHYLLPNFDKLSAEINISFLNQLLTYFSCKKDSIHIIDHPLITQDRINILKSSKVFPFVKNGIQEFTLISKLFSPSLKEHEFILDYPELVHSKENIKIFQYLGIRHELKKNDVVNQFKRISSDQYTGKTDSNTLIERARILWKSRNCIKVFDELMELNIVPVKESTIIGSRKMNLRLMPITEICHRLHEDLYFSVKLLSDVDIPYPKEYNYIDYNKIFENFVNLLSNVREWKKIEVNRKMVTDPNIIEKLLSMCRCLENNTGDYPPELVEAIRRIPVLDSAEFIEFTNMVMRTDGNNFKPFFNILPSNFSYFGNFFSKIGVMELNVNTIVAGLNRFLDTEINTSEGIRSLNHLYEILFGFGGELETFKNEHSPLPIFTEKGFIKPSNQVYYTTGVPVARIKTSSFYTIHPSISQKYRELGVLELSPLLREELNVQTTSLEDDSIDNSIAKFLNTLIGENQDFRTRVNNLGLNNILNIKVKSGDIRTKFLLNNQDITHNSVSDRFYDQTNSTLYLDKTMKKGQAFLYLFNSICLEVNVNTISNLQKEFVIEESTDLVQTEENPITFKFVDKNQRDANEIIKHKSYNTIALRSHEAGETLFNNQSLSREAVYHYCISTEMSLRSLLVFYYDDVPNSHSISSLRNLLSSKNTTTILPQIPSHFDHFKNAHLKNGIITIDNLSQTRLISSQFLNLSNQKNNQ